MAAKKKIAKLAKPKLTPVKSKTSKATRKKKPIPAKRVRATRTVAAFVPEILPPMIPSLLTAPPFVITYDLVAKRAFEIWHRKTHTNYPEQNWREAEAELEEELGGKSKE